MQVIEILKVDGYELTKVQQHVEIINMIAKQDRLAFI